MKRIIVNGYYIYKEGDWFDYVWVIYSHKFKVDVGYKTSKEAAIKFAEGLKDEIHTKK